MFSKSENVAILDPSEAELAFSKDNNCLTVVLFSTSNKIIFFLLEGTMTDKVIYEKLFSAAISSALSIS